MRRGLNMEPNTNSPPLRIINEMGNYMDEESDISDSEINEYKKLVHKLLKLGSYKVSGPNGELGCPFCVGVEKHEYHRLLEHAVLVAECPTESAKQRANHSAMAKYLVIDLAAAEALHLPHSPHRILCDFARQEKKLMDQMLSLQEEKTISIRRILEENDAIQHTILQEARDFLRLARDQSKEVLEQQEVLSIEYEYKRRRLNSWSEELNKREESLNEGESRKNDLRNNQMAEKLREAEENYRGVVERLKEKEVALSNLQDVHQRTVLKERQSNDELQQVRTELIKLLRDLPSSRHVDIGVKMMGEIDGSYELWNLRDNRKATPTEVISYINGRTCTGPP